MIYDIFMAVIAYVSTNIDDIFLLTLLFTSVVRKRDVFLGHLAGILALALVSYLGAYSLAPLLSEYAFLLGIVPILLGIKAIFDKDDDDDHISGGGIISVLLLTLSAGGDNVGIYLPLFMGMNMISFIITLLVFAVMAVLWCVLAMKLSDLPSLRRIIDKYKGIIVPVVFILLGISIIFSGI
ncbi:MAG: cadmium resistance transporter [Clostridia bacterium]|nr:cadmium resistance transporter [Clostridia bacterium]